MGKKRFFEGFAAGKGAATPIDAGAGEWYECEEGGE